MFWGFEPYVWSCKTVDLLTERLHFTNKRMSGYVCVCVIERVCADVSRRGCVFKTENAMCMNVLMNACVFKTKIICVYVCVRQRVHVNIRRNWRSVYSEESSVAPKTPRHRYVPMSAQVRGATTRLNSTSPACTVMRGWNLSRTDLTSGFQSGTCGNYKRK